MKMLLRLVLFIMAGIGMSMIAVAALSAAEITYIRRNTGNFVSGSDFYVDDDYINWLYANKADNSTDKTIVFMLRESVAIANDRVNWSSPDSGKSISAQQQFDSLKYLLERAEKRAGMAGGIVSFGVLNLGIDSVEDE